MYIICVVFLCVSLLKGGEHVLSVCPFFFYTCASCVERLVKASYLYSIFNE
jgi:hypothetical protein